MILGLIGGGVEGLPDGMRYPTLAQGKDTVADYLADKGFARVAFADGLKEEVAEAFGTTVERLNDRALKELPMADLALERCSNLEFVQCALAAEKETFCLENLMKPRSSRWVCQLWGTEYRRMMYDQAYWLKQGWGKTSSVGHYIFTDVRLPNEADFTVDKSAPLVRLIRPGTEIPFDGTEHPSEISLLTYPTSATWINREGDFEGLYRQIDDFLGMALKLAA